MNSKDLAYTAQTLRALGEYQTTGTFGESLRDITVRTLASTMSRLAEHLAERELEQERLKASPQNGRSDPETCERFFTALQALLDKYPDCRIGQLLWNATERRGQAGFYIENDKFCELLERYLKEKP